jgi:hypothetical protein
MVAGTGELDAAGDFLAGVLMASRDEGDTPKVQPFVGAISVGGSPDPRDPCEGYGLGSTIPGGQGPWKWVKGSEAGVHPEIPSTVNNVAAFNSQIVKWGGSIDDAFARMRTLTSSEIAEMGRKGLRSGPPKLDRSLR